MSNGGLGGLGGFYQQNTDPNNPYNVTQLFHALFNRVPDHNQFAQYANSPNTGVGLQREMALNSWNDTNMRSQMLQRAPEDYFMAMNERAGRDQSMVNRQNSSPFMTNGSSTTGGVTYTPITGFEDYFKK